MLLWHGVQLACSQSRPHVIVVVFMARWQVKQSGNADSGKVRQRSGDASRQ